MWLLVGRPSNTCPPKGPCLGMPHTYHDMGSKVLSQHPPGGSLCHPDTLPTAHNKWCRVSHNGNLWLWWLGPGP